MEYVIVSNHSVIFLEGEINEMIKDGWKPQGGLSVVKDGLGTSYCQAMIKE